MSHLWKWKEQSETPGGIKSFPDFVLNRSVTGDTIHRGVVGAMRTIFKYHFVFIGPSLIFLIRICISLQYSILIFFQSGPTAVKRHLSILNQTRGLNNSYFPSLEMI